MKKQNDQNIKILLNILYIKRIMIKPSVKYCIEGQFVDVDVHTCKPKLGSW